MIRDSQDAVFNRTGRADIPAAHIRRKTESGCFHFGGLHRGAWNENLSQEYLGAANLYVDIQSMLLLKRIAIEDVHSAFDGDWKGINIEVPPELTGGDYRVTMQVTIALPSDHPDAGRILARSSEIVLIDGPGGTGPEGQSLLKVRPEFEGIPDLSRLDISEAEGPVLYVNARIPGFSWKDLARDPKFKFGIFSSAVREILRYLVFAPECRGSWGAAWLALDGIKGRDIPEVDDRSSREAWIDANDYANDACEAFLQKLDLATRFALANTENEET